MKKKMKKIAELLEKHKQSLSLAESCTGGLVSAEITRYSGASKFYKGAIVSYVVSVKIEILGVAYKDIQTYGEVSEVVAKEMALGVKKKLGTDWSLSVTGIAGPGGGTKENPIGSLCFGVCGPNFVDTYKVLFKETSREKIQKKAVDFSLDKLLTQITHHLGD